MIVLTEKRRLIPIIKRVLLVEDTNKVSRNTVLMRSLIISASGSRMEKIYKLLHGLFCFSLRNGSK